MQARRLPARQGLAWFIAGFRLFRANPPLLTSITFGYLLTVLLMLAIPFSIGGLLLPLVQPMLTLLLASSIGIIVGFGGYLSIIARNLVVPGGVLPAAICFAVMLAISFISLDGLRRSLIIRTLLVPVLAIGAPMLLIFAG